MTGGEWKDKDSLWREGRKMNYKKIDFSRSFLLRSKWSLYKNRNIFFINSCTCMCMCRCVCVCVCDVFSFTITWSSGTVRASPSYIVYYILQNVATVHLTRSRGENVELSVSSDSMRSFKYVPGFWRSLYNEGLKPIESRRVQFSMLHGFGKMVPCLLYVHFSSIDSGDLNLSKLYWFQSLHITGIV